MTSLGIVLVFFSALCHTCWNTLSKFRGVDPMSFLTKALFYSAIIYFPLFVFLQFYVSYTPIYVVCVIASGLFCGLYFFTLAKAYETGDISMAYPVARSFPILVLAWAGLVFSLASSWKSNICGDSLGNSSRFLSVSFWLFF